MLLTASEEPRGNYNLEDEGRVVNRGQLDVQAAIPERLAPPPGNSYQDEFTSGDQ